MLPQSVYERITLTLIIKNINDNPPSFQSSLVSVSVPENAPIREPIEVPDLAAYDPDLTTRDLTYTISKNRNFDISASGGRVFLIPKVQLDRETDAFMGLTVRGSIRANPQCFGWSRRGKSFFANKSCFFYKSSAK